MYTRNLLKVPHLSAGLSTSIYEIRGGEDKVSVANTLLWSCIPNPTTGSAVSTTSVVSVWTTCPARPTVLEARDTAEYGRQGSMTLRNRQHNVNHFRKQMPSKIKYNYYTFLFPKNNI